MATGSGRNAPDSTSRKSSAINRVRMTAGGTAKGPTRMTMMTSLSPMTNMRPGKRAGLMNESQTTGARTNGFRPTLATGGETHAMMRA